MSSLSPQAQSYMEKIKNSFFGRWIVNYKVSFLVLILILGYGIFTAFTIPKESAPDIKFGIVSISTVYPGANPVDIDDTITSKIEDKIVDLDGIDDISSNSSLGASSVTITLENGVNVNDFIADVRNRVDAISLPSDATDPSIIEISTANEVLFQMILYADRQKFSMNHIRTLAQQFKDEIKGKGGIVDVGIDGGRVSGGGGAFGGGSASDSTFDMQVLLDESKLEGYGLTVGQVVSQIRAYNRNLPLGNYALGNLRYDYRIDNELKSLADLQSIPIAVNTRSYVRLDELANIVRDYDNDTTAYGGVYDSDGNHAVSLTIFKKNRSNVFEDSETAKKVIEDTLKQFQFQNVQFAYTQDLAETIIKDYKGLAENGVASVILVLIITALFIGLRQSLIATFSMPIAFFVTFMVLDALGMTMNFMVNFSLILSFGMGIDTVIVFVESGRENMKKGYNPMTAILITMHTYAAPNIITSLINIVVFIPMLLLPGITGKFLANIPITLFATLLASLFLALTINGALFAKLNTDLDYYYDNDEDDESFAVMTAEEKEILYEQRKGKKAISLTESPKIDQFVDRIRDFYVRVLKVVLASRLYRILTIVTPVGLIIATFVVLAPMIGFKLFPSGDNPSVSFQVTGREGMTTQAMLDQSIGLDTLVANLPELKSYEITTKNNTIGLSLTLVDKEERQRDSFEIQKEIEEKLSYLKEKGYAVEGRVQAGGPPTGKAVGLKLVAENKDDIPVLRSVAQEFEIFLTNMTGTINVANSSTDSPGQFSFSFDQNILAQYGLNPGDVQSEIFASINGSKAGSLILDGKETDIVVKVDTFADDVSPEDLENLVLTTRVGQVRLGEIADMSLDPSLTSVQRTDQDIVITVEGDLDQGLKPTDYQPLFEEFAENYEFPDGISYKSGGENAANADLIQAAILSFVVAIFLTFVLLVYQFNSFSLPAIVLYSIFTALLGVNIGLFVTGNPYSMAFAIGFISLIGVVVNTAIFLVDRINENRKKGVGLMESIIEAGQARFKPIIISTVTTILGVGSSVTQDEFYAGLGYTVMFGLIFSSVITLAAVPTFVLELENIIKLIVRIFARIVVTIFPSVFVVLLLVFLSSQFSWLDIPSFVLVISAIVTFIVMSYLYIVSLKKHSVNMIQSLFGYSIVSASEDSISTNESLLRYLFSLLNIIPLVLIVNIFFFLLRGKDQFFADAIFKTKSKFTTYYGF